MTPYSPAAIAKEAAEAICRYQYAQGYVPGNAELNNISEVILTAAARMVREAGAESALRDAENKLWHSAYMDAAKHGASHAECQKFANEREWIVQYRAALANLKRLST